jgi:hypothetical protein
VFFRDLCGAAFFAEIITIYTLTPPHEWISSFQFARSLAAFADEMQPSKKNLAQYFRFQGILSTARRWNNTK